MRKKTKKSVEKTTSGRRKSKKNEADPAEVREEIADMVKSKAKNLAAVVLEHAEKGELAPVRFLFEMAGVYPQTSEGSVTSVEEDCLAKTLLDRLNIPDTPVVADQQGDGEPETSPAKPAEHPAATGECNQNVEVKELVGV